VREVGKPEAQTRMQSAIGHGFQPRQPETALGALLARL
jgi:hypothetical protein